MLDSLPERPLSNDEAENLKQQDPRIVPLSILKGGDSPFVVYTLAFYLNNAGEIHLLGFSENERGWIKFKTFDEEDWTVETQEDAITEWIDQQYGDSYKQGMLEEDSKTVDMMG